MSFGTCVMRLIYVDDSFIDSNIGNFNYANSSKELCSEAKHIVERRK